MFGEGKRCSVTWIRNTLSADGEPAPEVAADLFTASGTSLGLLPFARYEGAQYTLVAVNTTDTEQTVPFWFPVGGDYVEELHGGDLDLKGVPALQECALTIPPHYGRIWTST